MRLMDMQGSNDLVSGYEDQSLMEACDGVVANNDEVMRQAGVLVRLLKLMDGGGAGVSCVELVERVAGRLEAGLGIWGLYLRRDEVDLAGCRRELEAVLGDREVLEVRRNVGDVGDEEYELKSAALDWSISDLRSRSTRLEAGVGAMKGLLGDLDSDVIHDIRLFSEGGFERVRSLGLGGEVSGLVERCFVLILDGLG